MAVVGGVAALEAMKLLLDAQPRLEGMLYVDLWEYLFQNFSVPTRDDCPSCALRQFPALDEESGGDAPAAALCGRNAVQLTHAQSAGAVDLGAIGERLRKHGKVVLSDFMLRADIADGGKPYSLSVFPDGRAIVHGTAEASVARSLYAKYVGL